MTVLELPTPDPRTFDHASRPFAEAMAPRYAIKREIGRGGMGVVFLARDKRLDRLVAIKTLPPQLAGDSSVRERFLRETRTAGSMAHANIVPILSADEVDGHAFFVMPFVEGESLASHIQTHGMLTPRVTAAYLRDVASALSHAHQRGIIHRDIKAENVLVENASGRALVTDFGIARIAEASPLTATGQVLGTVYYVSPEQVSDGVVDKRSDIYSLGVVGFLALTGRFPFQGDVASAVLVSHVTKAAPPVASVNRDIPAAMATIIDRCLMKDPDHRYANADALLAALETATAEMDRVFSAPNAPALVTNTEAHSVWKRAAELQANTGIEPRPEAVARPRDPAKNRAGGLELVHVQAAAAEAGIDAQYVDHALVEHGLKAGKAPVVAPSSAVTMAPLPESRLAMRIVHEFAVDGEMPARDVERLISVLRDETGSLGHTVAKTRELVWWTGRFGARLDVSMVPAEGQSSFRIVKSLRREIIATVAVSMVVVGTVVGITTVAALLEMFGSAGETLAVTMALSAALGSTFWVARNGVRWFRKRAEARVKTLGERLTAKVRESLPKA